MLTSDEIEKVLRLCEAWKVARPEKQPEVFRQIMLVLKFLELDAAQVQEINLRWSHGSKVTMGHLVDLADRDAVKQPKIENQRFIIVRLEMQFKKFLDHGAFDEFDIPKTEPGIKALTPTVAPSSAPPPPEPSRASLKTGRQPTLRMFEPIAPPSEAAGAPAIWAPEIQAQIQQLETEVTEELEAYARKVNTDQMLKGLSVKSSLAMVEKLLHAPLKSETEFESLLVVIDDLLIRRVIHTCLRGCKLKSEIFEDWVSGKYPDLPDDLKPPSELQRLICKQLAAMILLLLLDKWKDDWHLTKAREDWVDLREIIRRILSARLSQYDLLNAFLKTQQTSVLKLQKFVTETQPEKCSPQEHWDFHKEHLILVKTVRQFLNQSIAHGQW